MAFEIVWTTNAAQCFENIISYLLENWSEKEVGKFVEKTEAIIQILRVRPHVFRYSNSQNIHEVLITKHNLLIYQINYSKSQVELLTIFDTRQNPKKKKF